MKKITTWGATILLPLLIVVTIPSCQKESVSTNTDNEEIATSANRGPVTRAYRDSFDTYYNVIPDFINGWTPPNPGPAWYPGGGEGNVTHMGKAKTFFNQYVAFNPPFFPSVAAPVTQFFSSQLIAAGLTNVPSNVSSLVYDDKGNSIWFHSNGASTMPVSATRINFWGTYNIVGGTGKFSGATGEASFNGFFNPQNGEDASIWSKGWIRY